MDSAEEFLLFVCVPAGAKCKMLRASNVVIMSGTGDRGYNAPDRAREAGLIDYRSDFLLHRFRIAQPCGMKNVKIDQDVMI
ncbi:MAG: hypothetical protein WAU92_16865, partial [Candidatus Sulfotelmatobacter sp.]